jgi:hypothetical protein
MFAHANKLYITPEEYLRRERDAEVKSEYWDRWRRLRTAKLSAPMPCKVP